MVASRLGDFRFRSPPGAGPQPQPPYGSPCGPLGSLGSYSLDGRLATGGAQPARVARLLLLLLLLDDHAAGDPGAAVACRVGHEVVGAAVHHERAAVAIEERRGAGTERDAVGGGLQPATPVGLDRDIRQIAGVRAPRVEQAVLPSVGVEVVAGRIVRRRIAAP